MKGSFVLQCLLHMSQVGFALGTAERTPKVKPWAKAGACGASILIPLAKILWML